MSQSMMRGNFIQLGMSFKGLSGRLVGNLCDPVMRAIAPLELEGMEGIRFADFQALSTPEMAIPDVCLGLVSDPTPENVYLVGEFKTPWTVPETHLYQLT
ncbi:hypothetical protein N7466_009753 [Penicillium verhagenii]|uniref:uncharacterized protein n=1 Tax=Penicillium verhagenii TaxID=1562060 RepID=UPI0025452888|nr:uncharacterized protein N7466_009753 [Penicillium verhagenii]KAJ5921427.1 hypothetical protein N7466_009753 [Penicillium verhagenii]